METKTTSSIKPARILIVDDHPNTAAMLARVLSRFDTPVDVLTAHSGEEALELIGDSMVDILITDFMMSGINGLELIEKIREEHKPTHTILITAYDSPGLSITAKQLKIQDYLVKPVQPDKIRDIVAKVLREIRPPESASSDSTAKPAKILIADDYPDNIRLLSTRLKSEGYTFVTAANGDETLQQLRTEQPDLLLLDINMPGKDGFQVLEEMRADPAIAHIPVIVITAARITTKDVREGLTLGADDYVTKPVDWGELAARIRTKLRVKRAEDALRLRNQELGILPEISLDLGERLDVEALTQSVLSRTVKALDATNGHLVIFHPDGSVTHQLHQMFDFSPWTWDELQHKLSSEGIVPQVVSARQGMVVSNLVESDNLLHIPNDLSRSAISVPLLGRYDVLGVLTLFHEEPDHFKEDQLKVLQAIASQAAMAIENAQLYAAERKRVNELVAFNQLSHAIAKFARSSELFQKLPNLVHQILGYSTVALWLVGEIGLTQESIAGHKPEIDQALLELAPQKVISSGKPAQFSGPIQDDLTKKTNVPFHSAVAVPLFLDGHLRGVLSIHSNRPNAFTENDRILLEMLSAQVGTVLERIRLFESVEQEQKRLAAVLHSAADAILVFDRLGQLRLSNPAAQMLFSDIEAKIGQPLPRHKGYDDFISLLSRQQNSPDLRPTEIAWPDGRTFSVMVTPIEDGGQVAVLHDVSHFKSLELLKNQFLATATHDLKNPIFAVQGYSDFLRQAGPLNSMQEELVARIQGAAKRMQDLVVNLLEIARIEMGTELKLEKLEVVHLLNEIVFEFEPQALAKGQSLGTNFRSENATVFGDSMRLHQVLSNLVSNAIKYTPQNGQIMLETEQDGDWVWIHVKDTGIGIQSQDIPHLFEKFYRVQNEKTQDIEGNGLGLAIVKSIVEQHGGQVKVESIFGKGSCFSVGLPAAA